MAMKWSETPATLADFSRFTIQKAVQHSEHSLLSGRITKPGRFHAGQWLSLYINLDDDVQGVVAELDPDATTAVLRVLSGHLHPALVSGATFPVFDSSWADKLRLAIDPDIRWSQMQFVVPDAFIEPAETPGWRTWRIATPDDNGRTDGQIVPGGWDHEHCELCWQKIGSGGDRDGYVNESDQWVLRPPCYDHFIGSRDLRFVLDGPWNNSEDSAGSFAAFQNLKLLIEDYDLAAIRRLLGAGGNVNAKSKYGWTPLMLAASNGHQSLHFTSSRCRCRCKRDLRATRLHCAGPSLPKKASYRSWRSFSVLVQRWTSLKNSSVARCLPT